MTIEEILSLATEEQKINALRKKTIKVPEWGALVKEYDPKKHPVYTDPLYKDKFKKNSEVPVEKVTRIGLPWQKLAVRRMSELLFGLPVKLITSAENEDEERAAAILLDCMRRNRYDAVNLDRSKMLYASCEIATIWFAQEAETVYAGEKSPYKVRCKTFSPIKGDKLWPLFDEYDDLIALSVEYTKQEEGQSVTYFETYTANKHIRWKQEGTKFVEDLNEDVTTGKISGVYVNRPMPIWEEESDKVYEAEWTISRNGNYIRKNARPTAVVKSDEPIRFGSEKQGDNVERNVFRIPASGDFYYAQWNQAIESIKFHIQTLKQQFMASLQLPDMSSETMKESPMSGEARKMMFIDAQMKALDEQGIWLEALDREINVLRAILKACYNKHPELSAAFDSVKIDVVITPFQIRDLAEQVQTLSNAVTSKIMSRRTAVNMLGVAVDVGKELEEIGNDDVSNLFGEMNEPTE